MSKSLFINRISFSFFLMIISFATLYAQAGPQVASVQAESILPGYNGTKPLAGKTYEYRIIMGAGTGLSYVQLFCTNGIFVDSGENVHAKTTGGTFTVKVKWGEAGTGKIKAVSSNMIAEYPVNIENPSITIAGPNIITYGGQGLYSLTNINPNIKVSSIKWTYSTELKELAGSTQTSFKIGAVNNRPQILTNGLQAIAKTDYGDLSTSKTISIEPLLSIEANNNFACPNENVTYTISGFFTGATVTWASDLNTTYISGQGLPSAVFKTSGNGYAKVKAVVAYQGKTYNLESSKVWVGIPEKPSILGFGATPKEFVGKTRYTLRSNANGVDLTNGFTYSISGAATISQVLIGGEITIETNNVTYDSPFTLEVVARNKCGQSLKYYANGIVKGSGGGDEPPIIEMRGNFSIIDLKNQPEIKSVKVYNLSGVLVHSDNLANGIFDIKSTSLNDGIYIIEKFNGKSKTSEKVILKR